MRKRLLIWVIQGLLPVLLLSGCSSSRPLATTGNISAGNNTTDKANSSRMYYAAPHFKKGVTIKSLDYRPNNVAITHKTDVTKVNPSATMSSHEIGRSITSLSTPPVTDTLIGGMAIILPADKAGALVKIRSKQAFSEGKDTLAEEVVEQALPEEPAIGNNEEELDTLVYKYAEMISVEPRKITNFSLYQFIDDWYGTRYKYGGMDDKGIDCSAFSQRLYEDIFDVELLRTVRQQRKHSKHIRQSSDATEGDLVFFHVRSLRVSHVGVYLANGYFVHASRSRGVVISSLNNRYWHRRYAGCGRVQHEVPSISESDFIP